MSDEPTGPIDLAEARRRRRGRGRQPNDGEERAIDWAGCPVQVLGVTGELAVFIDVHGQRRDLAPSQFASWAELQSLFGGLHSWVLRECPPERTGMHSVPFNAKRLASGMMGRAAEAGVLPPHMVERGVGVWRTSRGLIVHTGDQIRIGDEAWCTPGRVIDGALYARVGGVQPPATQPAPATVGRELVRRLDCWAWTDPHAAELVTGWLFVAALGHAVPWRPHIWTLAPGGSGKTTLLGAVSRMLPSVSYVNRGTEPGLRRLIAGRAAPVLYDEGDDSEVAPTRMQGLVELARLLSGGTGLRAVQAGGSATDVTTFAAVGCVWWASIHPPPLQAQDRSRITFLPLERAEGHLDVIELEAWADAHAAALWARIIAGAGRYLETLAIISRKLRDPERGLAARMADQAGALISGAWCMLHDAVPDDIEAEALLRRFCWLWDDEPSDVAASDGEACLEHLLGSPARQSGPRTPLGELVGRARRGEDTAEGILRAHGLRWMPGTEAVPAQGLAVAMRHPALGEVFAGTPWRGGRWSSALGRLPDALTGKRAPTVRLAAGLKPRCVLLPAPLFDDQEVRL